jgi:transcriptional regulator with XRE-family HTH domain
MSRDNEEKIRERVLSLIDSEFESDAAFERALGLRDKTVNNWRRGRSSSYMKILPRLSEQFHVNVGELLDIPLSRDTSELSEDELHLLHLYRKSRTMPQKLRAALRETLENTIELYIKSASEFKSERRKRPPKS